MVKLFKSELTSFIHIDTVSFSTAEDFEYTVEGDLFSINRGVTNIPEVSKVSYTDFVGKNSSGQDITFDSVQDLQTYLDDIFTPVSMKGEKGDSGLPGPPGQSASEVEFRLNINILEWRRVGDADWIPLGNVVGAQGVPGPGGSNAVFDVTVEENSTLNTGGIEWAHGNGANTPADQGVPVPFNCVLFAGGLSLNSGIATVGVYRNGTKVFDIISDTLNPKGNIRDVPTPIPFSKGDVVGFVTTSEAGTSSPNIASAWFEKV